MNLVALPAFADNYIWMLHDGAQAVVVDPGDAASVDAALDRLHVHLQLAAILDTRTRGTHGYTLPNLGFAAAVEADNPAVGVLGRTADQPDTAQPRSGCHRSGPRPGCSNGGPGRRAGRLA